MVVNILTQRNAPDRQGINREETALRPGNVSYSSFGRIGAYPVTGSVYAQPLYVSDVDCGAKGRRNLLVVATMENDVYAFDADQSGAGAQVWAGGAGNLGTPVDSSQFGDGYTDFYRKRIGVLSTPTIEIEGDGPVRGTIYLVSYQFDANSFVADNNNATPEMFRYILYALDLGSGRILRQAFIEGRHAGGGYFAVQDDPHTGLGVPRLRVDLAKQTAAIAIQFAGKEMEIVDATGIGSPAPAVQFNAAMQLQRPGLLLQDGTLLIAFGSRGDSDPYHGWVFAYDTATLKQTGILCTTPNGIRGGIWQAGQGLVQDSRKNIFASTGNGDNDKPGTGPLLVGRNFGESFLALRLDNGLRLNGWFTLFRDVLVRDPPDQRLLDKADDDFGSSAPALLPDQRIVAGGKDGWLFLIDPDQLDKLSSSDAVPQAFKASFNIERGSRSGDKNVISRHIHGSPVVWTTPDGQTFVYVWGENDVIRVYQYVPEANGDPNTGRFPDQPGGSKFTSEPPEGIEFARGDVYASNEIATRDGMSGGFLSLSANGAVPGTAIVWASYPPFGNANNSDVAGGLVAFDASDFDRNLAYKRARMLWSSRQVPGDDVGQHIKFCCPTVANGRVFLATGNGQVAVYGLRAAPVAPSVGFGGGPSGLALNGSARLSPTGTVILTEHAQGEANDPNGATPTLLAGSVFTRDVVDIRAFMCTFTVSLVAPGADGFTFTIQAEGPHALGSAGSGLGCTIDIVAVATGIQPREQFATILHSFAVKFALRDPAGLPTSRLGLLVNGEQLPGFTDIDLLQTRPGPIDLRAGHELTVRLRYDGNILSTQIKDETTGTTTQDFQLIAGDISQQINAVTGEAFIGFTGGTGGLSAEQEIVAWQFAALAVA